MWPFEDPEVLEHVHFEAQFGSCSGSHFNILVRFICLAFLEVEKARFLWITHFAACCTERLPFYLPQCLERILRAKVTESQVASHRVIPASFVLNH